MLLIRPPFVEAAEGRLLYMVAGEVASIAKAYRRISKCALNMYRRLGEGAWPTQPGNRFVSFVRACVRAVLVKSFRSENLPVTACIFYL